MERLRSKASLTALAVASATVLLAAVLTGLRVPGIGLLPPHPAAGRLDYSAGPPGGFAPLDPRVVAKLLGSFGRNLAASATARPTAASQRFMVPPGRSLPRPVSVRHALTNDDFGSPYRIPSVPFTARTDTRNATRQPGEPPSCGTLGGRSVWYAFTPEQDIGLLADTLGTSDTTALTVYTGATLSGLRRVADCAMDARGNSVVPFPARGGTTYYFQIEGLGGDLVFTLQEQGVTTLASVGADGRQSNGDSFMGALSTTGNRLLFASGGRIDDKQENPCVPVRGSLLPCGKLATYERDRVTHRAANIYPEQSAAVAGTDYASLTAPGAVTPDGRYVAFWASVKAHAPDPVSHTPSSPYRFEAFRRDMRTGAIEQVSLPCPGCGREPNGSSGRTEMSDDGRYIAFVSWASNLVPGDDNGVRDVFLRDMKTDTTERVSVASDADIGVLGPPNAEPSKADGRDKGSDLFSISRDGRFVTFRSSSSNLVRGDTNGYSDVFIRNRAKRTTTRVNLTSEGREANGQTRTPLGLGLHTMSDDGRFVVFASQATNLVSPPTEPGIEHVYRRDLERGVTALVSVASTGVRANDSVAGEVTDPWRLAFTQLAPIVIAGGVTVDISPLTYTTTADGRFVAFNSDADNLVPGDTNAFTDIFLHDTETGTTTRVSVGSNGAQSMGGPSGAPSLSGDGRFIAFDSDATNLVPSDENDSVDVFVRELPGHHPLTGWH